ncbi:protein PTHB1 isoform X2 [Sitophilus oryzae]|uniref:Protein PTHB1 isoform X2 n=1 Tax=Sitophilus oryzae TaxID=7048 RepID=A0A6J2YDQ5_SITOR|nr:protein PTHB1 isoform X2 [Sitophilus oryzae]
MSLFKLRHFWSTTSEDDEYFDQNSLLVTKLNSDFDYIVTASQSGVLRIFNPLSENTDDGQLGEYHPNDVVVERIFDLPILQIGSGRLVSGNQVTHLAILHPLLLSVYTLIIKAGKTSHGNQSYLELVYEHKLRRSAYNLVIGPFGSSQNRDFICVQSLDGLLTFFEQESQVSYVALTDFLMPCPISYIAKTDSFVTCSSDWHIVCYKYKSLSEASDESVDPIYSKPKVVPDWTYNLGESIIDLTVINDIINKEAWLTILGEKNLYSLNHRGSLRFMKRLDYPPVCFRCYILVTIHRAFLKPMKGTLVLLSEEGRLECAYLGTEPCLFVAPPLNVQELDYEKLEKELLELEDVIRTTNNNDVAVQTNIEKELQLNLTVNESIEICVYEHNMKNAANNYMCCVTIDIVPQVSIQEAQLALLVQRPLKIVPNSMFYSNLSEKTSITCYVFPDESTEVPTLALEVKLSVISSLGVPRALSRTTFLPMSLIMEPSIPEKENTHKITLSTSEAPIALPTLFSEYTHEGTSANSIAFKSPAGKTGTILLGKSSERYRLQAESLTTLSLLVEQLVSRLKKYYSQNETYRVSFSSSLPAGEIFEYSQKHFLVKQEVNSLQNKISQLSSQYRLIQKRLIAKYRAKNPSSLKSLELLLDDTYTDILEATEQLENEMDNLSKAQIDLSCVVHLVKQLIGMMEIGSGLMEMINSTFCTRVYDLETQSWEDVTDTSLCYLLRTALAKTDKDKLRVAHTSFEEVKDMSKFEKHLSQVFERIQKKQSLKEEDETEDDVPANENTNPDTSKEDFHLDKPIGSQFGVSSTRLLSARKSLSRRRHKNGTDTDEAVTTVAKV